MMVPCISLSTGPSPPHITSTRVICSPKVQITWHSPDLESEVIVVQYRIYAQLLNSSRDVDHAIDLPDTHYEVRKCKILHVMYYHSLVSVSI